MAKTNKFKAIADSVKKDEQKGGGSQPGETPQTPAVPETPEPAPAPNANEGGGSADNTPAVGSEEPSKPKPKPKPKPQPKPQPSPVAVNEDAENSFESLFEKNPKHKGEKAEQALLFPSVKEKLKYLLRAYPDSTQYTLLANIVERFFMEHEEEVEALKRRIRKEDDPFA